MNQPSVFISCVSLEFRQTRNRLAAILTRMGYTPVIQEIFGTEPGDLRQVLRDKIEAWSSSAEVSGGSATANIGRYRQSAKRLATSPKRKSAPSCLSRSNT